MVIGIHRSIDCARKVLFKKSCALYGEQTRKSCLLCSQKHGGGQSTMYDNLCSKIYVTCKDKLLLRAVYYFYKTVYKESSTNYIKLCDELCDMVHILYYMNVLFSCATFAPQIMCSKVCVQRAMCSVQKATCKERWTVYKKPQTAYR